MPPALSERLGPDRARCQKFEVRSSKFDFDDRQQQSRTVEALLRCAISLLDADDEHPVPALLQRPCRNTWLDAPVAVALQHRAHFRRVNDAQGHDAVARADAAMYRAKRDGQDRVSVG